jgi:hypothetical protein
MSEVRSKGQDEVFCFSCGEIIKQEAEICPKCGVRQKPANNTTSDYFMGQIGKPANNAFVWILAWIPLIGTLFEFGTFVVLAINIILCIIDEKQLKKAGYETASLGSAWLIPVYLYKRAKMLGNSFAYFIVWCVCFGLSFFGFL